MVNEVQFVLNGNGVSLSVNPLKRLIDVLRDDLQITGSKEGCGEGECGACAVLLDGRLVNACLVPVGSIYGQNVVTIEGFRQSPRFEILKDSFEQAGSVQCGFCTPAMILAAEALLSRIPKPSEEQIRQAMAGNLCRCTGYNMIVEAVQLAGRKGDGLW